MLFDGHWKCIFWDGFRPQIYDLRENPSETIDMHGDSRAANIGREFSDRMFEWVRERKTTVTLPDERILISERDILPRHGIKIGIW